MVPEIQEAFSAHPLLTYVAIDRQSLPHLKVFLNKKF